MPATPLVSILMPAYNAEPFLSAAVQSALAQTWENVEVLIVDDGSSDGTAKLAGRLAESDGRIRVILKEHRGVSAARNAAIAAARGEFLCFLDADDMLLPDKIERQLAFLRLFPSCDLVFSDIYQANDDLTPVEYVSKRPPVQPVQELLLYRNWLGMMSPLMRTSLQQRVGGFDESLTHSEDWDFWIRAGKHGRIAYLPGPVIVYRRHQGQASKSWPRTRNGITRVIAKHFERWSREWRAAMAALAWSDAKERWADRNYVGTLAHLGLCVWYARSRRTLINVRRALSD